MALAKNLTPEESKELNKWGKIEEDGNEIELKRYIGGVEVVSKRELIELWKVNRKTIERYVGQGMPVHPCSIKTFQVFDLQKCIAWRDENINKTMSQKTASKRDRLIDESKIDSENLEDELQLKNNMERKLKADADDAELKVKLNEIKLAEAEGRVVDANDLDRAMAELAIVHKTDKLHDENLLPTILEHKDAGQIKTLIQDHNAERLKLLDDLIKKEFKSEESMYEIVEEVLQQLHEDVEPESLIKRLRESLI